VTDVQTSRIAITYTRYSILCCCAH